ncbi:dienelactone hydrolase family protein [bacterium]|nr:dienelactone hydrolase family protein [bacterium]
MRKILSLILISSLLLLIKCEKVPIPDIEVLYYKYIISTPKDYNESNKYPLIVFLHGYHANVNSYDDYKVFGLGDYAEEHEDFPFIVVAPQTTEEYEVDIIWKLVLDIKEMYSVDEDRIYVTGFSMGGSVTYDVASAHTDSVAAIAVIAGEGETQSAEYLKDGAVWIFHDKNDPVISYSSALDMYNALLEAGCDVKLTSYDNGTHSGWYETYTNPDLYSWFLAHSLKER